MFILSLLNKKKANFISIYCPKFTRIENIE